jgi:hypothetical protein
MARAYLFKIKGISILSLPPRMGDPSLFAARMVLKGAVLQEVHTFSGSVEMFSLDFFGMVRVKIVKGIFSEVFAHINKR